MGNHSAHDQSGVFEGNASLACQWSFNRAREFHHVAGDSQSIFKLIPAELIRKPVSLIDDPEGSWSARLDWIFSGNVPVDQWTAARDNREFRLVQIPVRDADSHVIYAAGFAFIPSASPVPVWALELAAAAALQCVKVKRTHATRFLHDTVSQSLSGAGLQLELLLQEVKAGQTALTRGRDIQQSLDQVLKLIREFNAPE